MKLGDAWSKQRILKTYMNQVYYGNHAYGVEAAAETYYSRRASQLTLPQAALIAGLPQAPTSYDPFYRSRIALARRNEVLRALLDNQDINQGQFNWAVNQGLRLKPGELYSRIREPYFFSFVRDQLIAKYGANTVRSGGLKVYTTIVPRYQRAAVKSIRDTLYYRTDPASALVAIDPKTGAIEAMTGVIPGKSKNEFNLAAQARRQAGSTFKTFVLTTAVRRGSTPPRQRSSPGRSTTSRTRPRRPGTSLPMTTAMRATSPSRTRPSAPTTRCTRSSRCRSERRTSPTWRTSSAYARRCRRCRPSGSARSPSRRSRWLRLRDARRRRDLLEADGDPARRPADRRERLALGEAGADARDPGRGRRHGDADPGREHDERDGHRRVLRAPLRRQDRHDREQRGRVVLRLYPHPRDLRLDRLSHGRDPNAGRARDHRFRSDVPDPDLEALHGVGDRQYACGRFPGAADGACVEAVRARAFRAHPAPAAPADAHRDA